MLMHADVDFVHTSCIKHQVRGNEAKSAYFPQVIKSKGGKESETEYFAALVNVHDIVF